MRIWKDVASHLNWWIHYMHIIRNHDCNSSFCSKWYLDDIWVHSNMQRIVEYCNKSKVIVEISFKFISMNIIFSNSLACHKIWEICKENEGDIILLLLNFFYLHSICTGQKISKGIFSLLTKINAKIDYTLGLILQTIFWTIFCPFLEEVTIWKMLLESFWPLKLTCLLILEIWSHQQEFVQVTCQIPLIPKQVRWRKTWTNW